MLASRRRRSLFTAFIVVAGVVAAGPAGTVEDGLMGVRIGASYREVLRRLGHSTGILFSAGGAMMYQTLPKGGLAGLPTFAPGEITGEEPVWVLPLRPAALADQQNEWVYDMRRTKGVVLGIILTGKGADAAVTDVIVAGFPENLQGKAQPVRTEKGIGLQSTFSEILESYGYPPVIEIYTPAGVSATRAPTTATTGRRPAAGGSMRAGGRGGGGGARAGASGGGRGPRGGMRGGGGGGRRRGALESTTSAIAQAPSLRVVLTGGMMGGGGGRRRGGGMRGGGGGGRGAGAGRTGGAPRASGRGALPPLQTGALPGPSGDLLTATAVVDNQAVGFSRDCILTYEGIAFTLHDMRVVRIHVSE